MLVLNAGIFAASRRIADIGAEEWRRVMAVNLDANQSLMRNCHPYLKLAPRGGRVVVIGSKNVPAPGPARLPIRHRRRRSINWHGSRRSSGKRPHTHQYAASQTQCSTQASGPRRCSRSVPHTTA